jgi:AbrB family looped-hinge helix DNA binding protein
LESNSFRRILKEVREVLLMASTHRAKLRAKGQVTLPGPVREALHVDENDDIEFSVTDTGEVIVRGLTTIPADQKWFWTPEWQAGEREASQQIADGRPDFRGTGDEFVAYLEGLHAEATDEEQGR